MMDNATSAGADEKRPESRDHEKHVHIIYVPDEVILAEMRVTAFGERQAGTITLAHVAKHIGQAAPTDIVVFNKEPYHFAGRPPGQPMQLRRHPQVHHDFPETILVIKPNEQAVWWSEKEFEVTDVEPSAHAAHPLADFPEGPNPPPRYPFTIPSPIHARLEHHAHGEFWIVRSGVPKPEAHKHMFKISFTIGGHAIDPDGYCSGN
jgi:hypothetical protein